MESVKKLANQMDIAYGRPPNPNSENYDQQVSAFEKKVARAKQVHTCEYRRCLVPSKNGSMRCKRRAPFPRADEDFITETGDWGMKRLTRQRLLIFRLVNTINREQECSHRYTSVFWSLFSKYLKDAFPSLANKDGEKERTAAETFTGMTNENQQKTIFHSLARCCDT